MSRWLVAVVSLCIVPSHHLLLLLNCGCMTPTTRCHFCCQKPSVKCTSKTNRFIHLGLSICCSHKLHLQKNKIKFLFLTSLQVHSYARTSKNIINTILKTILITINNKTILIHLAWRLWNYRCPFTIVLIAEHSIQCQVVLLRCIIDLCHVVNLPE